jgi:hypothetical protein
MIDKRSLILGLAAAMALNVMALQVQAGWKDEIRSSLSNSARRMVEDQFYDVETMPPLAPDFKSAKTSPTDSSKSSVDPADYIRLPQRKTQAALIGKRKFMPPMPIGPSPELKTSDVQVAFNFGIAEKYTPQQLIDAGCVVRYAMKGGHSQRKQQVKYVILHSTETASEADAKRVIRSWSNRGPRHPGTQYVIDRDGTIYNTVDPSRTTVHVNTSKTLPGFNNENSIGIEIVRAGKQTYTPPQLRSVLRLVAYLQGHYDIANGDVVTHGYVQPSDRSDPVGFDLKAFSSSKLEFQQQAIALKRGRAPAMVAKDKDPAPKEKPVDAESPRITIAPKVAPNFAPSEVAMPPVAPSFRK